MNLELEHSAEILDRAVGGFRQYILGEPISLAFISQNLCDMVGYSREELTNGQSDPYVSLIHPADREIYKKYLKRLCTEKRSGSAEYRLVKKDGSVLLVRDTMTVEKRKNGSTVGYSVLTDITALRSENENLRFLNETVPCGMLKYTCEKNPKVTYVNKQLLDMLRIPQADEADADFLEMYMDNIYLLIPIEERRKFAHFLNRVNIKGTPVAGEISVLRCDGTRARLYGWVTKVTGKDGTEEFQSVCMDVTERYDAKKANETERYLKALTDVYDHIFEYDFVNRTVKYVSGGSDTFAKIRNLPMQMEEATAQWIEQSVCEEDRDALREFFASAFSHQPSGGFEQPPQIRYRERSQSGEVRKCVGTLLKVNHSVSLFCCKYPIDEERIDALKNENLELRKNMQEFVTRFTEGVMAFKVENDRVKPLYASDNVCNFFGFSKEEWLALAEGSCSIKEFIAQSTLTYEEVELLFATGEAEFAYFDMTQNRKRLIKAICSQRNPDAKEPFYVMLYNIDNGLGSNLRTEDANGRVAIRTFGYFDVFIGDKPIAFRNKKAKELLALLVDRRGGYVTGEEAIGYLWENEPANAVTLARYRKEALRLKNTLEEYGIGQIMESVDGKRRIIPEAVQCDLFDYLSGKAEYASLFKGSYLTNYAWGEVTLGELMSDNTNGKSEG